MLDIQDLHIRFRNAPEGREAVKGISLHMDEGEILGLVGESGSGKTVTAMACKARARRSSALSLVWTTRASSTWGPIRITGSMEVMGS